MESNEEKDYLINNQLNEDMTNKNGFKSDSINRFGDDLFELIIDFLEIKDKIRFESINKQFNRCLFKSEIHLIIDSNNVNANQFNSIEELIQGNSDHNSSDEDSDQDVDQNKIKPLNNINKIGFEGILNKFQFIRGLDLTNCLIDREIIDLICNNCQYLKELCFSDNGFEEKDILKLGKKCGNGLEKILINPLLSLSDKSMASLLTYCPNLKEFQKPNAIFDCNEALLPKLKSLSMTLNNYNSEVLKTFTNYFKERLKSLKVIIRLNDGTSISNFLQEISGFTQLEKLCLIIGSDPENNIKPIDSLLSEIAINCTKLKGLEVCLAFCTYALFSGNLFPVLKLFRTLKALKICFPNIEYENKTNCKLNQMTINCFESIKNLSKLTLSYYELNDHFLKDIHKYIPNLKSLSLESGQELSDEAFKSLSKLDNLKTFRLIKNYKFINETFYGITDAGLESLLSARNIEIIAFRGRPQITCNTISQLIETANNNPKRKFEFICDYEHIHDCERIDMKMFTHLPTNLTIHISGPFDQYSDDSSHEDSDDYSDDDNHEDSGEEIALIIIKTLNLVPI